MSSTLQTLSDKIDRLAGTNSNSYTLVEKVVDLNSFIADLENEAGFSDSSGQWDDPRFDNSDGGRPVGTIDLEVDEKIYSFFKDADGNRILSIYKILYYNENGSERQLEEGTDYDFYGPNMELTFTPDGARVPGEDKNMLKIYFTREGLGFDSSQTGDESPFPGFADNFLVYKCVAEWCLSEAEDPSMRAKADRYEQKAEAIRPRFKKWIQRYHGDVKPRITGKKNNLR
jgi:hypothetical protein